MYLKILFFLILFVNRIRRLIKIFFTITIFILLTACATAGYDFKEQNISQLQIGITTPYDAESILKGIPYQTVNNDSGTFLIFVFSSADPMGVKTKMVELQFNNNVLTRISRMSGFELPQADRIRLMP